MKDLRTFAVPALVLIVDDTLADDVTLDGIETLGLGALRNRLIKLDSDPDGQSFALPDISLLGACLSTGAIIRLKAEDGGFLAVLRAQNLPIQDLGDAPDEAAVGAAAWQMMVERLDRARHDAAIERRAAAELRRTHMQVQDDHAELEAWVWDQLAPKYSVVRHWQAGAQVLQLGQDTVVRQPLPAPFRGLGAIDVQIAEDAPAGTLSLELLRPVGTPFEGMKTEQPVPAGAEGRFRLTLPRAGFGQPEDVVISLTFTPDIAGQTLPLCLAPATPFSDVSATRDGQMLGSPLAITVYRTLPRMPAPPLHDTRVPVPADGITYQLRPSQLEKPVMLPYSRRKMPMRFRDYPDAPKVELHWKEDHILVQPSVARPVVAMLPGIPVEGLRQVRAVIQLARHDTMPVAFALGAAPSERIGSVRKALGRIGDWVHLLPGEWGQVWYETDEPITGHADLFLVTAMPGMPFNTNADALFHAFRMTGAAKPVAETCA